MKTYNALRRRLQAFCRHYVECGVGTKAIKAIGYVGPRPDLAASKLLKKPRIRTALEELELTMQDEMRKRVYAAIHHVELIRNFDPRQLVDPTGRPYGLHELSDEVAAAIQGVEIEESINKAGEFVRRYKYRAAPKLDADKVILQYQRVLVQSHEHAGPHGGPIPLARTEAALDKANKTTDPNEAMAIYGELIAGPKTSD